MSPRSIRSFIASKNAAGFKGAGLRRQASVAAAITGSPQKAGASCRRSSASGSPLSKPFNKSPPLNMPDWKSEIRSQLSNLKLDPARELEIIEELSQHLDDRFEELVSRG